MKRQLSQQEIDAVFQNLRSGGGVPAPVKAVPFDFRRPDRIAKSHLDLIHSLHDVFVRNLIVSLSAYLRTYVAGDLISVEQLPCVEFLDGLPSPTCLVSLSLRPFNANAVLEVSPSLAFPVLEVLLGAKAGTAATVQREITELEQSVLDGVFRIIVQDLREAWKGIAPMEFKIEAFEKDPKMCKVLDASEPVVALAAEIRLSEKSGMLNLAVPSIAIKMMRQEFERSHALHKSEATAADQQKMLQLLAEAQLSVEARLQGPRIRIKQLLELQGGQVLDLGHALEQPFDCLINGMLKYRGQMVSEGSKMGFHVQETA